MTRAASPTASCWSHSTTPGWSKIFADDAHRLLAGCGNDKAYVFASSGGAVIALELARSHPDQLETVVCHEPPSTELMPDPAKVRAEMEEICDICAREGLWPAMQRFMTLVRIEGGPPSPPDGEPSPEALEAMALMQKNMEISLEMASGGPGAEAVVSRLTDALLPQAVRTHLVETVRGSRGAVSDPQVARPLRLIRERPEERWFVPKLTAAVGLSRFAFSRPFSAATGETPIQSLTRYRLSRAAVYLRTTNAGVREIALRTGYDAEVSVSATVQNEGDR